MFFFNDKGPVCWSSWGLRCQRKLRGGSRLNEDAEKPEANEEKWQDQPENDPFPCARSEDLINQQKQGRLTGLPFGYFNI